MLTTNIFRNRFYLVTFFVLLAAALVLAVPPVSAQETNPDTPTDDEVNAIARGMYCPVCENIPLDVCGTQACEQWRELIREKLGDGWSEQQIKEYFVLQYGDRVLATPPARGFNWMVYIMPPALFLVGVVILFFAFRRMRGVRQFAESGNDVPDQPQSESEDEYLARLEKQMREGL
jgi:cytochrome c-type biogenesis protein CcmH